MDAVIDTMSEVMQEFGCVSSMSASIMVIKDGEELSYRCTYPVEGSAIIEQIIQGKNALIKVTERLSEDQEDLIPYQAKVSLDTTHPDMLMKATHEAMKEVDTAIRARYKG